MTEKPILWWVRRDLRLRDNDALNWAVSTGRPIIPIFIRDAVVDTTGAAPKWRWGLGLEAFGCALEGQGSRLVVRAGDPRVILPALARELQASVIWNRLYDADCVDRDTAVKSALQGDGVEVKSFAGHLLFEPWTVQTQGGGYYKVYSPMWRAVKDRTVPALLAAPGSLRPPQTWPDSDTLADWHLGAQMQRGAAIVAPYACVGEDAALARLERFLETGIGAYARARDFAAEEGTSRLSENLTYGEISPRRLWHASQQALSRGDSGAAHFAKEVVWREFAYHLAYHEPRLADRNHRPQWDAFGWREDNEQAEAWRRGLTGVEMVDAAMRELYVTGTMHNRCRMIVGSFLTKHLLTDWRVGRRWFEDTLIDWDPASNALGWQWIAGCGPDAAPFYRIFNPETQGEKFDPERRYRDLYLTGGRDRLGRNPAQDFGAAVPQSWGLDPGDARPDMIVGLKEGRDRALAAFETLRK